MIVQELMEALVHQRKHLVLILLKQTQNLAWASITMLIIVICLLMEKKSLNLKLTITRFFLGSISNGFSASESKEVSIWSINYIDKSVISNIHRYLTNKINLK